MIRSYADEETRRLHLTGHSRRFANVARTALRKIEAIDFATCLEDLRNPPGNHLERLRGDRDGYYRIRVNDQYRVCFRWEGKDAWDVRLVDYH
ncbi:MAG: type II toxin-antitoxin system RelE/ParE family toxin [Silvibacterium sp.]